MKVSTSLQHPSVQITEVIRRIYRAGLTTTTGGNISIREENGDIWVIYIMRYIDNILICVMMNFSVSNNRMLPYHRQNGNI